MLCYPGQTVGLYEPPDVDKERCQQGINCSFGICSECTEGVSKEELNEAKVNNGNIDWSTFDR